MKRIRTIDGAYEELKKMDPATGITKWYIRQLVVAGQIPSMKAGSKYLVDVDALISFLDKQLMTENH